MQQHRQQLLYRPDLVAGYLRDHAPAAVRCTIAEQYAPLPWQAVTRGAQSLQEPTVNDDHAGTVVTAAGALVS